MSFEPIESSVELGEPIELYRFSYGPMNTQVHLYTDGEQPVMFGNQLYRPIPIKRSGIVISGTLDKAALTVNLPASADVPELYRVHPPSHVVSLEIYQGHADDPALQFLQCWTGRVLNCRWVNREATLTCEPGSTSLKRPGLRRNYQYGCPHVLYDTASCRASEANATVAATVQFVDGTLVGLSVAGATIHEGGMIKWTQPNGMNEVRTIIKTMSGAYVLGGVAVGLSPGMQVHLIKGCDHAPTGCALHNNLPNYGGQPWIPLKNPMSSTSPFK